MNTIILHPHELAALQAGRLSQIRRPVPSEFQDLVSSIKRGERPRLPRAFIDAHPFGRTGTKLRVMKERWFGFHTPGVGSVQVPNQIDTGQRLEVTSVRSELGDNGQWTWIAEVREA